MLKGHTSKGGGHDLNPALPITPLRPPRFVLATEAADFAAYLEEHGYAVAASVAVARTMPPVKLDKDWEAGLD